MITPARFWQEHLGVPLVHAGRQIEVWYPNPKGLPPDSQEATSMRAASETAGRERLEGVARDMAHARAEAEADADADADAAR